MRRSHSFGNSDYEMVWFIVCRASISFEETVLFWEIFPLLILFLGVASNFEFYIPFWSDYLFKFSWLKWPTLYLNILFLLLPCNLNICFFKFGDSDVYFFNFAINLLARIPDVPTDSSTNGTNVYIDANGDLVIETKDNAPDERIQIEIISGGTIDTDILEVDESW